MWPTEQTRKYTIRIVKRIRRNRLNLPESPTALATTFFNEIRMLHEFLTVNRLELIERCRAKVAQRSVPRPTATEMDHGIPLFLNQLIDILRAGQPPDARNGGVMALPSGRAGEDDQTGLTASATIHGHELLEHGFTVEQVVHDYGDLCQAVTELARELEKPVSADEFQTLNLCLDNAIAAAVSEFDRGRDHLVQESGNRALSERLGFLAHELRNSLSTAMLSIAVIKRGDVGLNGATGAVLDRSLVTMRDLIDRTLTDVRLGAGVVMQIEEIAVDRFIAQVQVAAILEAKVKGCAFTTAPVDAGLKINVDGHMLASALANLLQNAFKFTRPHSHVSLKAYAARDRVLIEIADECGGLAKGKAEAIFESFAQHGADRSGLGLGLSIARRAVEANGGVLSVRNMPGIGCVFIVDLPRSYSAIKSINAKATHGPGSTGFLH